MACYLIASSRYLIKSPVIISDTSQSIFKGGGLVFEIYVHINCMIKMKVTVPKGKLTDNDINSILLLYTPVQKLWDFFLRWQNMVFIFKAQTWNFVCGIRRSFAFTMENILSVWYTATPEWTSKFGKVWKTRCQNAATRANIWRCVLVSWDDKYLWVMGSNNRHKLYFF